MNAKTNEGSKLLACALYAGILVGHVTSAVGQETLGNIYDAGMCNLYFPENGSTVGKIVVDLRYGPEPVELLNSLWVFGPNQFQLKFRKARIDDTTYNGYVADRGYFMAFLPNPHVSGRYWAAARDNFGKKTFRQIPFIDQSEEFNQRIDALDQTRFSPADYETGVSLTPKITWDIVEEAQYLYQFRLVEGDGFPFLAPPVIEVPLSSVPINVSSIQVPDGLLKPNTTYTWTVEILEVPAPITLRELRSCALTPPHRFTTQ